MAARKPPSGATASGATATGASVDLKDYAAQARRIQEETLEQQLADPPGLPLEDWRPDAKVVRMSQLMPRMVMQGVGGRQLAFASPPQKGSIVKLVLSGDLAKPGDAKGSATISMAATAPAGLAVASSAPATAASSSKASTAPAAGPSSPVPALALGRRHNGGAAASAAPASAAPDASSSASSASLAPLPRLAALAAEERSEAGRVRKVGGTKLSLGAVAAHFAFPYNAVPEPRTAYVGDEERLYHVKVLPKESAPGLDAAAAVAAAAAAEAAAAEADAGSEVGGSGRGSGSSSAASKLSASARRAMAAAARIANMSAGARASMKALQKSAAKYESAVNGSSPRWLSARWRDKPIEPPVSPMAGASSRDRKSVV